jgi:hypothetical protein
MGRILFLTMSILLSMIIHDLDIAGIRFFPPKADPPTIIDPDAPLLCPITLEFFKPVAGWCAQKVEARGSIQLRQFAFCLAPKSLPSSWAAPRIQGLRVPITERIYHCYILYR